MKKNLLILFVLCWFPLLGQAQTNTVTGVVKDQDNLPLPGVSVVLKSDATIGTITDVNGKYTINTSPNDVLIFRFIGMKSQEVAVNGRTTINVMLQADFVGLDEVIAVGYGVQKKSDITGAVATVDAEVLQNQPVSSAATMLQGRASGVMVTQTSGAPGAGLSVRVRGTGTVNNSSPLYVVDGILLDDISHINPSDIGSMEVLKDASATAIYGSRGANGVILIQTKKGATEDVAVHIELMSGLQQAWTEPDLMNSKDWLETYNKAQTNAAAFTGSSAYKPLELLPPSDDVNRTTDWFDEVTRVGKVHKANVSFSRGDEQANTMVSVGYFKNEGIILNSAYERFNARLNNNYSMGEMWKAGFNVSISNTSTDQVTGNAISGILTLAQRVDPITPVYQESGEFASTPYSDLRNPVGQLNRDVRENEYLRVLANSYLQIEPINNLFIKTSLSLNLGRSKEKTYLPTYDYGADLNSTNSISKTSREFNGYLSENTVNYIFDINDNHNFSVLAGFTAEKNLSEYIGASRNNIPNDSEELQYISASLDKESTDAWNSGVDTRMYSYLARVNYDYAGKYFLTASVRRDGSSVFGPNKRFGNFPSASAGWRLRNESFMDFIPKNVVNRIKVRAGWGRVGNAKIDPYSFASTIQSSDSRLEYSYVFSDAEYAGGAPVKMANPNIQWETVQSTNIGLDLAFLNDKVSLSVDYFSKETKDMLVEVPLPEYAGYDGSPFVNAGTVENKGIELDLGYRGTIGNDLKFRVNLNASHVDNEVTSLGGGVPIIDGSVSLVGSVTRTAEGLPIGSFYGYQVEGVFQSAAEVAASAQKSEPIGAGDFRFKDQWTDKDGDGVMEEPDGVINGDDRTMIGDPNPDWFYGLNIDLNYKNWDCTMFFQGVQGNDIFNGFKYYNYADIKRFALANDYKNHWTAQNKSNTMFGLNAATVEDNLVASDFYVEDGSYLRLKNFQLGYTFRNLLPSMSGLRVYFSGQNLLTFTGYSGLDPEIGASSSNAPSLTQGIDYGTYPQARVFSIGASLTF
ncbi:TonB-linked outer membrane protein, SusC/RagA family [Saccharicrinis carchari]|uniref:TonB-linked outer membrane protein, SusC/RagA family n=1 Tax=Saccharicrinis carchari TaxID=1168039 RepID=A0A521B3Z2_SACCC|nr:TonB-dependent receptor [Saccharicrinis carchari]SMO41779.1 TonB-linked outer membrane protein, SusC/RagA family [Saccharicrinis carchari]